MGVIAWIAVGMAAGLHARRVSPAAEILSGHPANGQTPVPASSPANQA